MKIAAIIARILLGLIFVVFGLNLLIHFLPQPPAPAPVQQFAGALAATGYMWQLVGITQVIGGVLVLSGIFLPLGLVVLAPVIVNILLFHIFLEPAGLPPGIVAAILELFLAWHNREVFAPLFGVRHAAENPSPMRASA